VTNLFDKIPLTALDELTRFAMMLVLAKYEFTRRCCAALKIKRIVL